MPPTPRPRRAPRTRPSAARPASRFRNPLRHQLPVYSPLSAPRVLRALRPDRGDTLGAVRELLLREYAADSAVLCGSGTQALQLAIRAAAPPSETPIVALPGFSCFDLASAAVGANARILLYDLDPVTLSPNLDSLERALARGAQVAVISPLYGIPVDWEALQARADAHGAALIEDAAQGHGTTWHDRPLGALGRVSVLSFGRGKGWTGGGGGAVLFRGEKGHAKAGEELPATSRAGEARVAAVSLVQCVLGQPAVYGLPSAIPWLGLGETRYHPPSTPGRLARASAELLLSSRDAAVREAGTRRQNARLFLHHGSWRAGVQPIQSPEGAVPGYIRFPVLAARGLAGFASPERARRLGIAPSYPRPLFELPEVRTRLVEEGDWPGAQRLARELITLPTHGRLRADERAAILEAVAEYRA